MLYRQTPMAVGAHVLAALFIVYALWPAVPGDMLLYWLASVIVVSILRTLACLAFLSGPGGARFTTSLWTNALTVLAFLQALAWGLAVFIIWPEETQYRSLLIVTLAGIIAAGGVMLAVHRRSFTIYCLPIAIPTVYQLLASGGRLELTMAALIVVYSIILIVSVTRLGNNFFEGLLVRLQMESLSRMDPLTHIANRRGFSEYVDGIWQNAIRSGQSVGLIIADIDHFKSYNDRYGHPQGDIALTIVARVLTEAAGRGTDLCARVGGEEFAILMPSTEAEGARLIAEQVQRRLAEAAIPHESAPGGQLTVSIGYGALKPAQGNSVDDFYRSVDEALYEAKRNGRNRIERASS